MAANEWYADGLRFTCTQCGKCCTGPQGYVWINEQETRALAQHLNMDVEQFRQRYARREFGRWTLNENLTEHGYDCVLLARDADGKARCTVYESRPAQCRTWPFWPENLQTPRAWQRTTTVCPGSGQGRLYSIEQIRIIRDSNHRR